MKKGWSIITSLEEFSSLKKKWKLLEEKADNKNISVSYDWCYLWWEVFKTKEDNTFGYDKQLKIVVKYADDGSLSFVAPLILLKRRVTLFKIRFLEFLGQQWAATTYSFLISPDFLFDFYKFRKYCTDNLRFDIFYLRNVPINENRLYNDSLRVNAGCPQIALTQYESYQQLYSSYPKNLRQNIRTAYNRAKKRGCNLELCIEPGENVSWENILSVSGSKKRDGKYSLYDDEDKKKFFTKLATLITSNFVLAKLDNTLIAYRYNIFYHGMKFCIDASYDRDFPQYNLGAVTVCRNIEDSYEKDVSLHSMGPGCYDYKLKFTSDINYIGFGVYRSASLWGALMCKLFSFYLSRRKAQL